VVANIDLRTSATALKPRGNHEGHQADTKAFYCVPSCYLRVLCG
jgi:hypothetical protein